MPGECFYFEAASIGNVCFVLAVTQHITCYSLMCEGDLNTAAGMADRTTDNGKLDSGRNVNTFAQKIPTGNS